MEDFSPTKSLAVKATGDVLMFLVPNTIPPNNIFQHRTEYVFKIFTILQSAIQQ